MTNQTPSNSAVTAIEARIRNEPDDYNNGFDNGLRAAIEIVRQSANTTGSDELDTVMLGRFVAQYEEGAQGFFIDADEAQEVALQVKAALSLGKLIIDEIDADPDVSTDVCIKVFAAIKRAFRDAPANAIATPDTDSFYEGRFFVATVSEDGREIGLDHPTDADWSKVKQAHIALRDRLTERLAEEDMCPHKPPNAQADTDRVAVLTEALDIARKQIVEITCDATEKLREVGYECDPPERTYMPALDRIDAALSQPLGSQENGNG